MRSVRLPFGLWSLALWLVFAACVQAVQTASLSISPAQPDDSWPGGLGSLGGRVTLAPNEDATATVSVAPTGTVSGTSYQLSSGPSASITGSGNILWTGSMSGNSGTFSVCNTGQDTSDTTVSVSCVWSPTSSGGGGGGGGGTPPPDINGLAEAIADLTGGAYVDWTFTPTPHVREADGVSAIDWTVAVLDGNGSPVPTEFTSVQAVNLAPSTASWTVSGPPSGQVNQATGTVTSTTASTGNLKAVYSSCGITQEDTSSEILAFGTVEILRPRGSADLTNQPAGSFIDVPPYHYDFQCLTSGALNAYGLQIEGDIQPVPRLEYNWTLDASMGTLGAETTSTPTHSPPSAEGSGTLTLEAFGSGGTGIKKSKKVEAHKDQLAMDMKNFKSPPITDCRDFVMPGGSIPHQHFVCHNATVHAYNGTDPGTGGPWLFEGWVKKKEVAEGVDLGPLNRGDVVAYYDNEETIMHSQTCTGNAKETWGANNIPPAAPGTQAQQTWKYGTSEAGKWSQDVHSFFKPITIKVYAKPSP